MHRTIVDCSTGEITQLPLTAEEIMEAIERAADLLISDPPYRRQRSAAYPPIADQLDAIWKGGADAEAMRATVMAVKESIPK